MPGKIYFIAGKINFNIACRIQKTEKYKHVIMFCRTLPLGNMPATDNICRFILKWYVLWIMARRKKGTCLVVWNAVTSSVMAVKIRSSAARSARTSIEKSLFMLCCFFYMFRICISAKLKNVTIKTKILKSFPFSVKSW